MKVHRFMIVFSVSLIFLTSTPSAYSIYGGNTSSSASNVVSLVKEHADGNRYGGCSGALLSDRIVVTAAHCVTDNETGLVAKSIWVSPPGAKYKDHEENGKKWNILEEAKSVAESRAIYERYKAISVQLTSTYYSSSSIVEDNDVAFLVIENPLPLSTPITLASDQETEEFIENETTARIYGYGQTEFEGASSKVPMTTTMKFAFKSESVANSAYLISANTSACPGDSGGPVIVSTPSKLFLVGIISGGSTSKTGPACAEKLDGAFYVLITLVTKYANLAFQAATIAVSNSETSRSSSDSSAKTAKEAQAKAEADAKTAKEVQAKAEADAKTAKEVQAKAEADAKTAKEVQAKLEIDLRLATDSVAKAEATARAAAEASAIASSELEKVKGEILSLNSQLESLKASLQAAQTSNSVLSKKLAKICKVRLKPKGC